MRIAFMRVRLVKAGPREAMRIHDCSGRRYRAQARQGIPSMSATILAAYLASFGASIGARTRASGCDAGADDRLRMQ